MKVGFKLWLENSRGEPVFGRGKLRILETIEKHKSMNKASQELGMSYMHLMEKVKHMESRLGLKLVRANRGGRGGGGAELTPKAKDLIKKYEKFSGKATKSIESEFDRAF